MIINYHYVEKYDMNLYSISKKYDTHYTTQSTQLIDKKNATFIDLLYVCDYVCTLHSAQCTCLSLLFLILKLVLKVVLTLIC